jgi:hypothetical protein
MTESDLALLKASVDRVVTLEFNDGESQQVLVHFVSDEDQDVIYDFVPKRDYAALARWDEIRSVRGVDR